MAEQLGCAGCAARDQRIVDMSVAQEEMADELSGLMRANRKLLGDIERLKRDESKKRKADPHAETIETLLELWMRVTGRDTRRGRKPDLSPDGDNWKLLLKLLRRNVPAEELAEAITGVGLKPYKVYGKRYGAGEKDDLANTLRDCVGFDAWREKNAQIARAARRMNERDPESMFEWYRALSAQAACAASIVLAESAKAAEEKLRDEIAEASQEAEGMEEAA